MLRIEMAGKSQMKSRNRVRVFREILKQGLVSRKQLERILSLSAPSVTRVVEELLNEGLVYEDRTEYTQAGRRPVLLCVKKNACYSIGVNLSKSKLYYCVKNLGGELICADEISLAGKCRKDEILKVIEETLEQAIERAGIEKNHLFGIGIASRGTVDEAVGSVIYQPDLGEEIPVKAYLGAVYDCTILVENNVIADLKGQYLDMNGTNRNLVYLYISDGVGGSIICNGKVVDGEYNMAGKFAHILVETGGRLCPCKKAGHLEAYVSKPSMEEAYFAVKKEHLPLAKICELAKEGDQTAQTVVHEALDKLAIGLMQILLVLNPGTLVLYGELFEAYDGILELLKEKTRELAFSGEITNIRWIIREKKNVKIEECIAGLVVERALEILR